MEKSHQGAVAAGALSVILLISVGLCGGIGAVTFLYAHGLSYLSNDPRACANCHVMNQQYEGWVRGDHHHVAVCNDCHVPHNFFGKWFTKAENGLHHSWAFTFSAVPVNIVAREVSRDIAQKNCVRCHQDMAAHAAGLDQAKGEELRCVSCHRSVGHGR